jgi:quinol monooxygenase YgiN
MPFTRRDFVSIGTGVASVLEITPTATESALAKSQTTKVINLDDHVTFKQQLEHNIGPVVLMSRFLVPPDQVDNFLAGFRKIFEIMRKQPGLISAQLHRGIAGSGLFMNYVIWASVDDFKHGCELPEYQAELKHYPPGTVVSASLFQRVAMAGMCVGEGTIAAE